MRARKLKVAGRSAIDPAAEAHHLRQLVGLLQIDARRSEVPVRHAVRVCVLDGVGHARGNIGRLQDAGPEPVVQRFVEQLAVDALQSQVTDVVHAAGVEHGHDVRMM